MVGPSPANAAAADVFPWIPAADDAIVSMRSGRSAPGDVGLSPID